MIGKGVLREHFQPRTCSGTKTPKTGQVKGNVKNIVLIDIDSDQVDDVVIIDLPEFVQQKLHGSSVPSRDRTCPRQSVISIDDDDESDDAEHPGIIAEGSAELDGDASSNKRFSSAPSSMQNLVHIDVDDCRVVYEKGSVSNMPKSTQTCSAKATDRNCYGLDGSESDSYKSDCSDCELIEVCEQWEKAFVKRKHHVFNDRSGYDEHSSSSGFQFHSNIYTDIEVENRTEQHAGSPVYSGPSNGKYVQGNQSSFSIMGDSQVDGIYFNLGSENPCKDSDQKVDQESFESCRPESERARSKYFSPCTKYKIFNLSSGVTGASRFKKEFGNNESRFMNLSQEVRERKVDNKGTALRNKNDNFSEVHCNCASFDERHVSCDGLVSRQSCNIQLNAGLGAEEKFQDVPKDFGKSTVCSCSGVEVTADAEVISMSSLPFKDSQDKQKRSCLVENENPSDLVDALHAQDGGVTASDERDIINEREKLKETDEYKRAIEEEWASRQQHLQIQADEAQRLRKRKRAENKRLLDMQRRQKERIEEVRETQKKDEEFMNMKEHLRVEIRKGLNKLEMQCIDMTSLLRGLGIQMGGGPNPLPNEVQTACKRALFKFHPDRASKTDIREQVEAEEKFKLLSRMKEKFLLTSCY